MIPDHMLICSLKMLCEYLVTFQIRTLMPKISKENVAPLCVFISIEIQRCEVSNMFSRLERENYFGNIFSEIGNYSVLGSVKFEKNV